MNTKGQINSSILFAVIPAVVVILFLGIVLSSAFIANKEITEVAIDNQAFLTTNETFSWNGLNNTFISLAQQRIVPASEALYNTSLSGVCCKIQAGANYTMNYEAGSIKILNVTTQGQTLNTTLNITYSYFYGSQERNITLGANEGIKVISDFQPTFGTILAVAAVIVILTGLVVFLYKKME